MRQQQMMMPGQQFMQPNQMYMQRGGGPMNRGGRGGNMQNNPHQQQMNYRGGPNMGNQMMRGGPQRGGPMNRGMDQQRIAYTNKARNVGQGMMMDHQRPMIDLQKLNNVQNPQEAKQIIGEAI